MKGIVYDFSGCAADNIGTEHGVTLELLQPSLDTLDRALARLGSGEDAPGFVALPSSRGADAGLAEYVAALPGDIESVLVLGIGGSSLGPRAVIEALSVPMNQGLLWSRARQLPIHFMDNVDPELAFGVLNRLNPARTLFLVVSKSGSTVETAAQFIAIRDLLRNTPGADWKKQMVIVTDPDKGPLRKIAGEHGVKAFDIPAGVGGRFSVLTPVGLLPSRLAGIDTTALLKGATEARDSLLAAPAADNPAALSAAIHVHYHARGMPIRVTMPYRAALSATAEWFQQLWGESLGKNANSGSTPATAIGVTDQHSQLQLYMEGPRDKVITFWSAEESREEVAIGEQDVPPAFSYLGGKSLTALLKAELLGTRAALTGEGRPTVHVRLDRISEDRLGALLFALELETVLAAELYGVNAYDQPGVEAGKKFAFGILNREGFEEYADEYRKTTESTTGWTTEIKL